eukprot:436085_1
MVSKTVQTPWTIRCGLNEFIWCLNHGNISNNHYRAYRIPSEEVYKLGKVNTSMIYLVYGSTVHSHQLLRLYYNTTIMLSIIMIIIQTIYAQCQPVSEINICLHRPDCGECTEAMLDITSSTTTLVLYPTLSPPEKCTESVGCNPERVWSGSETNCEPGFECVETMYFLGGGYGDPCRCYVHWDMTSIDPTGMLRAHMGYITHQSLRTQYIEPTKTCADQCEFDTDCVTTNNEIVATPQINLLWFKRWMDWFKRWIGSISIITQGIIDQCLNADHTTSQIWIKWI